MNILDCGCISGLLDGEDGVKFEEMIFFILPLPPLINLSM